jgi:ribosomal protein S19
MAGRNVRDLKERNYKVIRRLSRDSPVVPQTLSSIRYYVHYGAFGYRAATRSALHGK